MTKEKAIELINTLEVVESDADGEILYYALVRNDEETRSVLRELGADVDRYIEEWKSDGCDTVDISVLAFGYAEWFDGEKFILKHPWN